ncbi:C-X-C motif chemokine 10-like [Tiliqua scincoides]|uniref:C-X-C motif chemokine 10-like n=1 Tax=Tiliqua scincoides TaxID=71010 RepID=UPI0034621CCC
MNRNFAIFLCMAVLLQGIQGIVTFGRERCKCLSKGSDFVPYKKLEKLEMHPRSSDCDHVEIIATLKPSGEQLCLNPASKNVQQMLENMKNGSLRRRSQEKRRRMGGERSHQ